MILVLYYDWISDYWYSTIISWNLNGSTGICINDSQILSNFIDTIFTLQAHPRSFHTQRINFYLDWGSPNALMCKHPG